MPKADFDIRWIDRGREPQCPPNPAYPKGVPIVSDAYRGVAGRCRTALPYPAPRCGYHFVTCNRCGLTALITAAGRPDDPRSLTVSCKPNPKEVH